MERKLLVSDLNLGYEGLFDAADFFKLIDDWFRQNGYDKNEIKHVERVTEKGKFIDIEIMPIKEISTYARFEVNVRIIIKNLIETKVKKNKQEFKINKGELFVSIDVFLATDVKNRLESKPWQFFTRTLFNKYVNKDYINRMEKDVMNDVKNLHSELKAYLNLERYKEMA
ncbi:TPA: hypothetical protein HA219_00010 [Candidatus Woesearchaeota archaeon]|nr:hypothetical protein [Candidatus Woesearchaeota archaeon]HIH39099.1 hypothetical protein [Candidatus Woesearchaeota archaeon]